MSAVDDALLEELRLRSRLNALVHERAEALREAERLDARATLPGADAELSRIAGRWRAVAERVAAETEEQRAALRAQEAVVARLRAEA
ncbi:MAG TPA: hypothetical protein VGW75_15770 [Solirubrobacteraceae bacterium]|jgi:hypothetical protein|nr:hypothetical protein [Solirubrobacteraceae bacterium]